MDIILLRHFLDLAIQLSLSFDSHNDFRTTIAKLNLISLVIANNLWCNQLVECDFWCMVGCNFN